jgi:hypothetical protein
MRRSRAQHHPAAVTRGHRSRIDNGDRRCGDEFPCLTVAADAHPNAAARLPSPWKLGSTRVACAKKVISLPSDCALVSDRRVLCHFRRHDWWAGLGKDFAEKFPVERGEPVECHGGGKEVYAADVAQAVEILLKAEGVAGEVYNCYDRYISQYEVAALAKEITGSRSEIRGGPTAPKHQIDTQKIQRLGMRFGGRPLLKQTIRQMLDAV